MKDHRPKGSKNKLANLVAVPIIKITKQARHINKGHKMNAKEAAKYKQRYEIDFSEGREISIMYLYKSYKFIHSFIISHSEDSKDASKLNIATCRSDELKAAKEYYDKWCIWNYKLHGSKPEMSFRGEILTNLNGLTSSFQRSYTNGIKIKFKRNIKKIIIAYLDEHGI